MALERSFESGSTLLGEGGLQPQCTWQKSSLGEKLRERVHQRRTAIDCLNQHAERRVTAASCPDDQGVSQSAGRT